MEPAVHLCELTKIYRVSEREAGLGAAMRSLVRRKTRDVRAVDRVSFDVAPGEIVGFLGPNGAGKTTTLKMLSGLLYPTSGTVRVLGYEPYRRQRDFLRSIALVMGNRNQLFWDIPAIDTYELNRVIYRLPRRQYQETLDELVALLDLEGLINKPVRNLSLGERMKCEIAGALLHRPRVLFLDEPTIGLDVTMQRRIRRFVGEYNQRHGATVLLTSHYMADVEALARRVVVIHHGRILFDGALSDLVARFASYKTIVVDLPDTVRTGARLAHFGEVVEEHPGQITLRVPKAEAARVAGQLLAELDVHDLTIQDPPIEEVIERVFAQPES